MAEAEIGDERSRENLIHICTTLAAQPGIAFSRACGEGKRKAAHRLFRQRRTTPQSLLKGHIKQTSLRCCQRNLPLVLAASDTTIFDFSTHPKTKGLGPIGTSTRCRGFLTHSVLAMTPEGLPLGLLHQKNQVRSIQEEDFSQETKPERERRKSLAKVRPYEEKESYKWLEAMHAVEAALPESQQVLLIQDREADIFEFLSAPRRSSTHLLIRAAQPRRVLVRVAKEEVDEGEDCFLNLFEAVERSCVRTTYTFEVGRRADQGSRLATMEVRCLAVCVLPSRSLSKKKTFSGIVDFSGMVDEGCSLWVIQVREVGESAPKSEPLCWTLLSTLTVLDEAMAVTLAQYYARRWQIERFHYVLKSGCQVERLQMDSVSFLQSALSLYSVVAWWLLYLTHLARLEPDTPAEELMSAPLLRVVSAGERRSVRTVQDLVFALGKIGGFRRLPSAPYPGVKSLWLGLRILYERYRGWQLAVEEQQNAGQD